jgi:hypothetical protein
MSEAPYPPAEPPADGDRTTQVPPPNGMAPRFSASASVPVPPAGPAPGPGAYASPTSQFGQGMQYGQPAQSAQFGQDEALGQPSGGQSLTGGQARAANVPAPVTQPNPPPYGPPSQGYQQQPQPGGTYGSPGQQYGSPTGQGQFGSAPGQAPFGQPPPGQGSFGGAPGHGQPPPGQGGAPAPSGPQAGAPGYAGGGYDRQNMPASMAQQMGSYGGPAYGQPPAEQGRPGGQPPLGGRGDSEQEGAPRKSKRGLIVTSIVVVVLIVVGIGAFVGWSLTNRGSAFVVDACVKKANNDAVVTNCSGDPGVYKITSIVDAENGCPDANQPSLVLTQRVGSSKKWACLAPAS